ncbi:MAG TPA: hypothetical protein VJ775_05235 [Sphingomicrobium sp.]|jgi:hypothetical protein|nr:hypothetical protein [Sphingomicrobium sp.]
MIIALAITAAANLAAAPAAPAAAAYSGSLENLFISACLDGAVSLSREDAQPIQFDALPKALKSKLGSPDRTQVWMLQRPGHSYLYTVEYDDRDLSPKVCGLASDQLKINPATEVVAARLNGMPGEDGAVTTEWHFPEQGYFALASRVREYTVLQVNQMSDFQRQEALRNR